MLQPSVKYNPYYAYSKENKPVTHTQKAWKRQLFFSWPFISINYFTLYINTSATSEKFMLLKVINKHLWLSIV